jgi:predicted DNA-binding protein
MRKKKTSIRLSEEAQILIEQLSKHLGISQSAVLEQAIRVLARREGIPPTLAPNKERGFYP